VKPVPGGGGYFQLFYHPFTPQEKYHMDQQVASNIPFSLRRPLKNILAFVPGTDPRLRNQYIILSAHYDHAGVADSTMLENGKLDSIFNGARDNATGTAAVIAAARYFARYPPRRSILFICFTAEEEGEIGSKYYVQHPAIPLDHSVFNLNVDNAGYNTTHAVCLFGLGRTSADSLVRKACREYGLAVLAEPGGQDLFKRSDNYPLAQKGIPAPCYSMGITAWDDEIRSHYHRLSDEVDNMDPAYVVNFVRAYILCAQYIANDPVRPKWTEGDEFEQNWQTLFGKPVGSP
jgi:Zn-dependent M28 family amino/carboxypeptidase